MDQAYAEFGNDPAFAIRPPTREQVARAWAWAKFKNEDPTQLPTHLDVVAALKKLFPEFRTSKPVLSQDEP